MPVFQVRQDGSRAIVWTGAADGEDQALEAMAHAAGFRGKSELPENITSGGLTVEPLNFSSTESARTKGGRSGQTMAPDEQAKRFG